MIFYRILPLVLLLLAVPLAAAQTPGETTSFAATGVVVDVHTFFKAVAVEDMKVMADPVAGRALVTEKGVYAFLETPENAAHLKDLPSGSVVAVKGKLLPKGALLHIDALDSRSVVPLIDFAAYRNDAGKPVTLRGTNKCQCGLSVGDLPHSCQLGHLHHLETGDGALYHYLHVNGGGDAFLGKDSHFRPVEVEARLLPGNFLLVDKLAVGGP